MSEQPIFNPNEAVITSATEQPATPQAPESSKRPEKRKLTIKQKIMQLALAGFLGTGLYLAADTGRVAAQDSGDQDKTAQENLRPTEENSQETSDPREDAEYLQELDQVVEQLYNKCRDSLEMMSITKKVVEADGTQKEVKQMFVFGQLTSSFKNPDAVKAVMRSFINDAMVGTKPVDENRPALEVLTEQAGYWNDNFTLILAGTLDAAETDLQVLLEEHNAKVQAGTQLEAMPTDPARQYQNINIKSALPPSKAILVDLLRRPPNQPLKPEEVQVIIKIITTDFGDFKNHLTVEADSVFVKPSYDFKDRSGQINAELFNGYTHGSDGRARRAGYLEYGIDPQLHPDAFQQAVSSGTRLSR